MGHPVRALICKVPGPCPLSRTRFLRLVTAAEPHYLGSHMPGKFPIPSGDSLTLHQDQECCHCHLPVIICRVWALISANVGE